ncbi:MAG: hypothetical protein CBD16_05460 [Betaproteobacteria bacterium TMED156]|nr:MAG: hypothetical protein CBD16_05460 [Betaproteobacteria bacterium TMED156]
MISNLNKILNKKVFFILLFCFFFLILCTKYFAIHLHFFLGGLPLSIDEAQYFSWSQELDFGYFSKPPFIAWVLNLNTFFLGSNYGVEVRNLQPLAFAFSSIFVGFSAFEITKRTSTSLWAVFLFFLLPVSSFYSQFATTDAWLLFFWSTSLYFFIKAIKTDNTVWWVVCGIAVGLGLLTKYSMSFFLISSFLFLYSRRRVFYKKPWISFLVSLVIFSPNIFWNIKQKFPTLKHHAEMTNVNNSLLFDLQSLMEFFLGQFIVFGPLIFFLFLCVSTYTLVQSLLPKKDIKEQDFYPTYFVLPIFFSWPLLISILLLSFFGETEINWAAPAGIGICLTITSFINQYRFKNNETICKIFKFIFSLSILIHLVFLICFISGPKLFKYSKFDNNPNINPYLQVSGYECLVDKVNGLIQNQNNLILVADDRGILANLANIKSNSKLRSWKKSTHNRHHWDLKYPLLKKDFDKNLLLIKKISSLELNKIDELTKELRLHFDNIKKIDDPELDNIILQGKKNQHVVLFWVNKK